MANAPHPFFEPAEPQPVLTPEPVMEPTVVVEETAGNDEAGHRPHPFFEPATTQAVSEVTVPVLDDFSTCKPVMAPTAMAVEESPASGGVSEQISLDLPFIQQAKPAGDPALWEAAVTDTGAATARLPEQQTKEPTLGPVEQQVVTVSEWLVEAEEAGEKLSGAEVGRRLGLSTRTGQRRLDKAAEYLAKQRRQ
ncbi:hypothetical protein GT043_05465 [Streptomyces sp. SID2131]|nr:hypothetical protein [Streptomyces sp. SID2131]